jgi:phosphoglycerate kinase
MTDVLTDAVSELLHPSRDLVVYASKGLLQSKRVLLRLDLNLPCDESTGALTDLTRLEAALPTIRLLISNGARVGLP